MATISLNNSKYPPPKWFAKWKKAILILTVAANAMIASWGLPNEVLTTRLQLWCTIGIVAILEALEVLLKETDDTGA